VPFHFPAPDYETQLLGASFGDRAAGGGKVLP